ncbi:hypothetical protein ACF05W_37415, partial [Streptomyces lydicus]|uniref:hypothetical protein n=1 Tax=Streptomyces lydicus TaxID=47763 RepID=UPI0037006F3C
ITTDANLADDYPLGRLRPWQRAGDWAAHQVRSTEPWAHGDTRQQAVVVLVHALTAQRTNWRTMRARQEPRARNRPSDSCSPHYPTRTSTR